MVSLFLSYDRDDAAKAKKVAAALTKAGHAVWWDQHINSGTQYSKAIEQALEAADVVVVLWSADAVESPWVRDEAASGRDRGCLVPVTLDKTLPPLGFRQFQSSDLSNWKGRGSSPQLRALVADVADVAARGRAPLAAPEAELSAALMPRRRRLATAGAIGIALLATVIAATWWFRTPAEDGLTVSVLAAESSPASRQLAAAVRVALGNLHNSDPANMQLLDTQNGAKSDLQVKISSTPDAGNAADATLTSRAETILWSKHYDKISGTEELKEVIAASIGSVLRCATEEAHGVGLTTEVRRLYLKACAADEEGVDPSIVIPQLRQVTINAPKFASAWARLLNIESMQIRGAAPWSEASEERAQLMADVRGARKGAPELAELKLAELALAPGWPLQRSIGFLNEAVSAHPDNPNLLTARSEVLAKIGAMSAATSDTQRASKLNQVSPILAAAYIRALIFEGKTDEARRELRDAQVRWPAVPALRDEAARIELRYGDFMKALPLTGARMDGGILAYIKARRQPTRSNKDAFLELARTHDLNPSQKRFLIEALPSLDRVDDLFGLMASWPADRSLTESTELLFSPWTAPLRRDPRFMVYAQRVKLLDYWQSSGDWPDFCSEPDMPYNCKAAAAAAKREVLNSRT